MAHHFRNLQSTIRFHADRANDLFEEARALQEKAAKVLADAEAYHARNLEEADGAEAEAVRAMLEQTGWKAVLMTVDGHSWTEWTDGRRICETALEAAAMLALDEPERQDKFATDHLAADCDRA